MRLVPRYSRFSFITLLFSSRQRRKIMRRIHLPSLPWRTHARREAVMPTFYELFAGIGLVRDALEPLGWQCVYANDIDATKEAIYRHRYPRDLWEVDVASLPRPVDLITASFPCIDLSLAGNRKGLAGTHSGSFWALIRLLDELRHVGALPKAVMIENVTGFLSSHEGQDFRAAVHALNERGYVVDAIQVSAEHFTPQSRPRLFLLAVRADLAAELMILPHDELRWRTAVTADRVLRPDKIRALMLTEPLQWGVIALPPLPRRALLLDAIIDWQRDDWWDEPRVTRFIAEMETLHQARLRGMMGRQRPQVGTAYRRVRHGRSVYEVRADGVAGCLRTAVGGSSKQIVVVVEGETVKVRWMAPVEYARLQGVRTIDELADFRENDLRTAFGDAVCVPTYRWIARHGLRLLGGVADTAGPEAARQLVLA